MQMGEEMLKKVVKEVKGVEINGAFPRMTYKEAMSRYGSDKPDTRFEMELIDVSQLGRDMDFKVLKILLKMMVKLKQLSLKVQLNNILVKIWML